MRCIQCGYVSSEPEAFNTKLPHTPNSRFVQLFIHHFHFFLSRSLHNLHGVGFQTPGPSSVHIQFHISIRVFDTIICTPHILHKMRETPKQKHCRREWKKKPPHIGSTFVFSDELSCLIVSLCICHAHTMGVFPCHLTSPIHSYISRQKWF